MMSEQQTIEIAADIAQKYGPWTAIVLFFLIGGGVLLFVIAWRKINDTEKPAKESYDKIKALEDELFRMRESVERIFESVHHLEVAMEKKVPYEWAEAKIIPKIDELRNDMSRLTLVVGRFESTSEIIAKSVERLTIKIESMIK